MPAYSLGTMSAWAVTSNTDQIISAAKTFQAAVAGMTPLTVRGASGQTANLQEWRGNDGTLFGAVGNTGLFLFSGAGTGGTLISPASGRLAVIQTAGGAGSPVIQGRGAVSQTGNLLQLEDSAGAILFHVRPDGSPAALFGANRMSNGGLEVHPQAANVEGINVYGRVSQTARLQTWRNSAGTILADVAYDGRINDNGHIRAMSLVNFTVVQSGQNNAGHPPARWDGTNFWWSGRILLLGIGRSPGFGNTHGHYDLILPAAGTVIPGYAGAANQTVGAAGIPIPQHTALYAILDTYGPNTAYSYALVGYTAAFAVPSNWILVASVTENGNTGGAKLRTAWGAIMDVWKNPTFQNGWVNYGQGYNFGQFYKDTNGFVHLRGLITGGLYASNVIFNLPVGFRPAARCLNVTIGGEALARIDVLPDGNVLAVNGSGWLSMEGISFLAEN